MKKVLQYLLYVLMALAAIVRFAIFLQSRDLFLDEVNVARNLYERDFVALLQPLAYEQFAPPLFLWITKASALLFGFSEMALRLFPYLSGIVSILLLVYLIDILLEKKYAIYPMALFAGGYLFLHYNTELKQYSSDFMMTLLLLVAAIKSDSHYRDKKFLLIWILLGSLGLWLSMPSVFILFGIGLYWVVKLIKAKDYKALSYIIVIGGVWFLQFGLYFLFILKDQISSAYLQNYHDSSFLYFSYKIPAVVHDLKVLSGMLGHTGGFTTLALITNSLLLLVGSIALYRKEKLRSLLFFAPLATLMLASILHKYALADRLVLFIFPILFVLLAYGVYIFFQVQNKFFQAAMAIILSLNVFNHQNFKFIFKKLEIQEIHYALDEIENRQALKEYDPIWVHNGAVPAFMFYTKMSPKKRKYEVLFNQNLLLAWDADYAILYNELATGEGVWILLTNYFPYEKEKILAAMKEANLTNSLEKPGCLLLHYEKP